MTYETPTIVDHGTLVEMTAMMNVGGPVDTYAQRTPGPQLPDRAPRSERQRAAQQPWRREQLG